MANHHTFSSHFFCFKFFFPIMCFLSEKLNSLKPAKLGFEVGKIIVVFQLFVPFFNRVCTQCVLWSLWALVHWCARAKINNNDHVIFVWNCLSMFHAFGVLLGLAWLGCGGHTICFYILGFCFVSWNSNIYVAAAAAAAVCSLCTNLRQRASVN